MQEVINNSHGVNSNLTKSVVTRNVAAYAAVVFHLHGVNAHSMLEIIRNIDSQQTGKVLLAFHKKIERN